MLALITRRSKRYASVWQMILRLRTQYYMAGDLIVSYDSRADRLCEVTFDTLLQHQLGHTPVLWT